jgi:endonuclease III
MSRQPTRGEATSGADTTAPPSLTLPIVLRVLRRRYGRPPAAVSTDPFELILWEQVAYLAPDARRTQAYEALRRQVGLEPSAIVAAPLTRLRAIARLGGSIAASTRAQRMHRSAETVLERWNGDLRAALRLPLPEARKALGKFPMIGEPGADKILAFTGAARLVPLDSNGLRVLQRLGLADPSDDYRRAYQAAQAAIARTMPRTQRARVDAYFLLRQHGQETCRRGEPQCPVCPLRVTCPTARMRRSGRRPTATRFRP